MNHYTNDEYIRLQYLYILNNLSYNYSNIICEYQRTLYQYPHLNNSVENYTEVIQNYQRDTNLFLTIIQQQHQQQQNNLIQSSIPISTPRPPSFHPQHYPQPFIYTQMQPPPPSSLHEQSQPSQTIHDLSNNHPLQDSSIVSMTENDDEISATSGTSSYTRERYLSSQRNPPLSRPNQTLQTRISSYRIMTEPAAVATTTNTHLPSLQTLPTQLPIMEDVIVCPTIEQIQNAMDMVFYDEVEPDATCPIGLEPFTSTTYIMRICHCGHTFNGLNIMYWLQHNVRCPICRYDIRDYVRPDLRDLSNNDIRNRDIPAALVISLMRNGNIPENSLNQTINRIFSTMTNEWMTLTNPNPYDRYFVQMNNTLAPIGTLQRQRTTPSNTNTSSRTMDNVINTILNDLTSTNFMTNLEEDEDEQTDSLS